MIMDPTPFPDTRNSETQSGTLTDLGNSPSRLRDSAWSEMISDIEYPSVVLEWAARLRSTGFSDPEILSATYNPEFFGNAEAEFRIGPVRLRIERERFQELLSVAFDPEPEEFYPFEDIEVAWGWATSDEVSARQEPVALNLVLGRLRQECDKLIDGMTGVSGRLARARIERVGRKRRQVMLEKLSS